MDGRRRRDLSVDGWANTTNTAYVPEYWKFDAMTSYKFTQYNMLQLNVYNLTNKLYYAQYFGNNVVPASGISAALTWRVKFVPDPTPGTTIAKKS